MAVTLLDFYQPFTVPEGACLGARLHALAIWLERAGEELRLASRLLPLQELPRGAAAAEPAGPCARPDHADWQRWQLPGGELTVRFTPALPDRSLVARPEVPVAIPGGQEVLLHLALPLWIGLSAGERTPLSLGELPTAVLSNTWFGDYTGGEACYSLFTAAWRTPPADWPTADRAVCPVRVHNQAAHELTLERLFVPAKNLSLYAGERHLWSDEVEVTLSEVGEPEQMAYEIHAPGPQRAGRLIGEARVPLKRNGFKVGISRLAALLGRIAADGPIQFG